MKKIRLLTTLILCGFIYEAGAQNCYIFHTYDNAGNRIKREYKCQTIIDPTQPDVLTNPGGVVSKIYPVPTPGPFVVEYSMPITDGYLFLTDMLGMTLMERYITQPTTIVNFDISPWVPGNYILTSIAGGIMESFTITKL